MMQRLLATVVGGYNIEERKQCAQNVAKHPVAGFILEGFHLNGESALSVSWEELHAPLMAALVRCANVFLVYICKGWFY